MTNPPKRPHSLKGEVAEGKGDCYEYGNGNGNGNGSHDGRRSVGVCSVSGN